MQEAVQQRGASLQLGWHRAGRVSGVNGVSSAFKQGPPYLIDLPGEVQAKEVGEGKKDMF